MRAALALALLLAAGCGPPVLVRPGAGGAPTDFRYRGPGEEVWLVGSMSDWRPLPMPRDGGGFALQLALPPGRYEYRLEVREGSQTRAVLPPGAERADDGFGGENAVLRVAER